MSKKNHIPMRTCLACRHKTAKHDLARYVLDASGTVQADRFYHLPGRGAYVCKNDECLKKMIKSGGFSRAFKTYVPVDETDIERLSWIQLKS